MTSFNDKDQEILCRCFSGDKETSEILVRRFSDMVYRTVRYTLMGKHVHFTIHDLEDLHNTVFLQLFEKDCKKLRQYQGKNGCSLASWIKLITVRIVLNHLRKKGHDAMAWQKKRVSLEDMAELKGDETEALSAIEKTEQERLFKAGIKSLSSRERLFIKLLVYDGLPVSEVAETMHLSIQNAYSIKHRTIQKLRSCVASATRDQGIEKSAKKTE